MAYKKKLELYADKFVKIGGTNEDGTINSPSLEGYYLGSRVVDGDYGPKNTHYLQTSEGVAGVSARGNLDRILTSEHVGQMVLITHKGMKAPTKKGRKASYVYGLEYDPDNTIDTSGMAINTEAASTSESSAADDSGDDDLFDDIGEEGDTVRLDEFVAARPAAPSTPAKVTNNSAATVQAMLKNRQARRL